MIPERHAFTHILALIVLTLWLTGCQGKDTPENAPPAPPDSPETVAATPADTSAATSTDPKEQDEPFVKKAPDAVLETLDALAPSLPDDVFLLMVFDNGGISQALLDATEGLFNNRRDDDRFASDLDVLMRAHFGVDLTSETSPLIVAISPPPSNWFGLFSASLPKDAPSKKLISTQVGSLTALSFEDEAIYRVALEDIGVTGVFFSLDHLETLDAIRQKQADAPKPLTGTPQLDAFKTLLQDVGLGQITLIAKFNPTLSERFFANLPIDPLDGIAVALDRHILATVTGPESSLDQLSTILSIGKMELTRRLKLRNRTLDKIPLEDATSALLSFHLLEAWSPSLHPKRDETGLHLEIPGLEPAENLALVGFFAAIALPAMVDLLEDEEEKSP